MNNDSNSLVKRLLIYLVLNGPDSAIYQRVNGFQVRWVWYNRKSDFLAVDLLDCCDSQMILNIS